MENNTKKKDKGTTLSSTGISGKDIVSNGVGENLTIMKISPELGLTSSTASGFLKINANVADIIAGKNIIVSKDGFNNIKIDSVCRCRPLSREIEPEKPSEEDNNLPDDHFKKRINKEDIDNTSELVRMAHPTLGYIATLGWVGIVRQPAIWFDGTQETYDDYYISYEGYANYMDGTTVDQKHLAVPRNGEVLKMKDNTRYFFNSHDSVTPNKSYSLDKNNTSIVMNNVSIYNKAHDTGIMINLRASFDGLLDDENIGGNVNILCAIDNIE